ncbi:hypothetical protein F5Y15DRAFT_396240 [Xylariaceae sp. FL0016]|nr:hypothetical protein F5Y15DRAFT_396240 [Xylariaceae sp. FL0016]
MESKLAIGSHASHREGITQLRTCPSDQSSLFGDGQNRCSPAVLPYLPSTSCLIYNSTAMATGAFKQERDDSRDALLSEDQEQQMPGRRRQDHAGRFSRWTATEIGLLGLLLVLCMGFVLRWLFSTTELHDLDYFSHTDKVLVPFDHDWENLTDSGVKGQRYADDRWKGMIPVGGGSVSVTHDFADKYDLPKGVESTVRPGEMQYMIAGYHQLHCLSEIRDQLYEMESIAALADGERRDHVLHCVEAVRQALYCSLDPTLINLEMEWPHVPNGQNHVCRNREALKNWAEEHKHPLPGA